MRPDAGWPSDRRRPETPPPWAAVPASAADLPENYVPRHSVQTPGPAADPAEPISGPIPVVRPAGGLIAGDARAGGGALGGAAGPVGGPSLPPSGLPMRRRRGAGPGTPLQADTAPAAGPWLRPGPIVPHEPARRLGAPPEMLGAPEPIPAWGLPLASPPRGFAVPVVPDVVPDVVPGTAPGGAPDVAAAEPVAPGPGSAVDEGAVDEAAVDRTGVDRAGVDETDDVAAPNGHAPAGPAEVASLDGVAAADDDVSVIWRADGGHAGR